MKFKLYKTININQLIIECLINILSNQYSDKRRKKIEMKYTKQSGTKKI